MSQITTFIPTNRIVAALSLVVGFLLIHQFIAAFAIGSPTGANPIAHAIEKYQSNAGTSTTRATFATMAATCIAAISAGVGIISSLLGKGT